MSRTAIAIERAAVLLVALTGALLAIGYFAARSQPVALPDVANDRLPCVSYTPFRRPDQSPLVKGTLVTPEQIDVDLALLATRTSCVRTYSVDQGLDEVPRLARKHGMRVLLGIWLGREAADNEREIERALAVMRRDADAIEAVIVGNEVLLRRELPAAALQRYIERVRAATPLPVTYADVWEFWLRHRELAGAVSFVTVHLLPYWEDDPTPVDRAVAHVMNVHALVRNAFPGKAVLIGEVGWPSTGRRREGAVPSLVNEARFIRELANAAAAQGLFYNVVEAFDQPWKRRLEGTVGGYWGVLDTAGVPKFSLRGPIVEDAAWRTGLIAGGIGALVFLAIGVLRRRRPGAMSAIFLALAGVACGAALWVQYHYLQAASRDPWEWLVSGAYAALSAFATLFAAIGIARWLDRGTAPVPASIAMAVDGFRTRRSGYSASERGLGAARFALLFGGAVVTLLLAFDPRYRDFPLALYACPVVGYTLLAWIGRPHAVAVEERALVVVLLALAPVIVLREGLQNVDALAWNALWIAFSVSLWLTSRVPATSQDQRAEQKTDRAGLERVEHQPRDTQADSG